MPDALNTLLVPPFPRAADYCGLWAIEPARGAALWELALRTDLRLHVAEAKPPERKSEVETVKAGGGQQVAVVKLAGTLMKARSSMSGGTSTVQARRDIRAAAADPDVSAILLAVDSPGGTVAGTADLAADVRAAAKRKPVWAFVDDLGASAAYWVASQADRVVANDRTALVGSIGTLAVVYDLSAAAEREGVKALVFGTGPLKGAGTPGAPVTEAQQDYFRGLVEDAQKSFDAAVRKARGLTDRQLEAARTGGVFGAAEALDRKLIDGVQSFDQTLADLAAEARRRGRTTTTRAAAPVPVRSVTMEERDDQAARTDDAPATAPPTPTPEAADPVAAIRRQAAAEMGRIADVERIFGGKHAALKAKAVAEGWGADKALSEFRGAELEDLRNSRPGIPAGHVKAHEKDCNLEAVQAAVLLRAGGRLDAPAYRSAGGYALGLPAFLRADLNDADRNRYMDAGHRYADLSLVDLCREALRLDGREAPLARKDLIRAAFSGGSLTNIFTTSVNAMLLASYMATDDTTDGWTTTVDVADFKSNDRMRLDVMNGLNKLPRGKAADQKDVGTDSAESYKIARYAGQVNIDEQDIIDDSMNALGTRPAELGRVARRVRPDLVYAILLANPTLSATTRALFNATDGNLGTTSALAATTLRAGVSAMWLVRENGVNLNVRPSHLVVPPSLRHLAMELTNSSTILIAGTAGSVTERGNMNALTADSLAVVADARLENGVIDPNSGTTYSGSATTWFLASNQAHTIEVGYLRGTGRAPQSRSYAFDREGKYGLGFDVCIDIGAKALDWRGLRKTTA